MRAQPPERRFRGVEFDPWPSGLECNFVDNAMLRGKRLTGGVLPREVRASDLRDHIFTARSRSCRRRHALDQIGPRKGADMLICHAQA
jgi:hypothetical protein